MLASMFDSLQTKLERIETGVKILNTLHENIWYAKRVSLHRAYSKVFICKDEIGDSSERPHYDNDELFH